MFCTKCGSKIEEGSRFCVKCGAPVEQFEAGSDTVSGAADSDMAGGNTADSDTVERDKVGDGTPDIYAGDNNMTANGAVDSGAAGNDLDELAENAKAMARNAKNIAQNAAGTIADNVKEYASSEKVQNITGNKELLKKIAVSVIALVVIFTGAFAFSKLHKHTLKISDYTTIEYAGCNNYGTAVVDFDRWQLTVDMIRYGKFDNKALKQVQKELKKSHKKKEAAKEFIDDRIDEIESESLWGDTNGTVYARVEDLDDAVYDSVLYELEQSEGLKNGDQVVVNYTYDKKFFKKYGINLKGDKVTDKVKDLADAKEVDPFEKISVEFEGTSPHATANIINNNDDLSSYISSVTIDGDKSEFKLGDTVTVVINADEEGLLKSEGIHLSSLSKEYTCEGVNAYVESAAGVSDDVMQSMKAQAEDAFRAGVARDFSDEVSLKGVDYIGNYFLKTKEGMYSDYNNQIYIIFKVTVKKKGEKKFSYYYYTRYHDIILMADGTVYVDTSAYDVPYGGWFSSGETFEKQGLTYAGYMDLNSLFSNCVTSQSETNEYENNVDENAVEETVTDDADDNDDAEDSASDDELSEEYILPNSSTEKLTKKDIKNLSLRELNYAKNEIYARHGRKFDSPELNNYFQSKSWYNGTIDPDDFSDDMLSEIERKNVKLLKDKEFSENPDGYQLDQ